MAKAIEQTPILEGKDASRFLNILAGVDEIVLEAHEKEVKEMIKKIPKNLKLK